MVKNTSLPRKEYIELQGQPYVLYTVALQQGLPVKGFDARHQIVGIL